MRHWAILLAFAGAVGCATRGGDEQDAADGLDGAEEDAWAGDAGEDGGEGEDGDGLDGDETMDAGDADAGDADAGDADAGDAGDPGDVLPCPEQQPHEKYCIRIGGPICSYEISFCRDGQWQCYAEQEHPPPMPEFEDKTRLLRVGAFDGARCT